MSDVYSDNEQLEALRHWWSENWKALVAGLVLGLAAVIGWQLWRHHRATHQATAAQMYTDFSGALVGKQDKDVHAIAEALTADYANTPYASIAQMKLAQADVTYHRYDDAAKRLQWVVEHGNDAATRNIAGLRLAAVMWQQGKNGDALKQLAHPAPEFVGLYAALRGDIEASQNKVAAARAAYQEALAALPKDSVERPTIEHKLGSLPVAPAATAKAPTLDVPQSGSTS